MTLTDFMLRVRGADRDRERARHYERLRSKAALADALEDQDELAGHLDRLPKTGFPIGHANTAAGLILMRVPREAALTSWLVMGSSGSGKTTAVKALYRWGLGNGLLIDMVDCKGDLYRPALREIAAFVKPLPADVRAEFVKHLLVIKLSGDLVVPKNPCRLGPGTTAESVAYDLTLAFARYSAAVGSALSVHMESVLRHSLLMMCEAKLSPLEIPLVLHHETLRTTLALRSENPLVREFFLGIFPTLPPGSAPALAARLQAAFMHDDVRLPFGADGNADFRDVILSGHRMVISLEKGGAPEAIVDLYGSLFIQDLCRSIFAAHGKGPPRLIFFDEFFHLLEAPAVAARFCTLLSSSRTFGVHPGFVMHQFAQAGREVREALLANVGIALIFRTSEANATHLGDFLPASDAALVERALRRGESPPSRAATRAFLMERLQRQENRVAYLWDRRQPYNSVRVRIQDYREPHDVLGIGSEELDEFVEISGIARGGYAVSRDVVRRQIGERQERLLALAGAARPTPRGAAPRRKSGRPNLG